MIDRSKTTLYLAGLLVLALALVALASTAPAVRANTTDLAFDDARAQSHQFIEWYETIELTPEQEAVKKEALEALPAPCCSDNTAYTCCCPCNLSKTVWGLSNHLIAEKGYDADQVRASVEEWLAFINPSGPSGDACYTGGCGKPFAHKGCGGMGGDVIF